MGLERTVLASCHSTQLCKVVSRGGPYQMPSKSQTVYGQFVHQDLYTLCQVLNCEDQLGLARTVLSKPMLSVD
jgi:hypothetical protein